MNIQVSLDLFQGSKLSFHHFDGGNKNVVVGKGYVGGPKLFFLRILRIDKRWKISTLAISDLARTIKISNCKHLSR